jgi:hypothetical protein
VRRPAALFAAAAVALVSSSASAYRPFDGTDGDTADVGEFELELGPSHYYRFGSQNYLIAPATVLNFGIFGDTELVIDFQDFVALDGPSSPRAVTYAHSFAVLDTDVFLKHTFRRGVLQGKAGLSIAAEGGPLTPEINGNGRFGASLDVILSYRWGWGTLHFNEWEQYTREAIWDEFSGVIIEGPAGWTVRPVGEMFVERDGADTQLSGLVGAIWTLDDSLQLDVAVRAARIRDTPAGEIRLGLTWAIAMWGKAPDATASRAMRRRFY